MPSRAKKKQEKSRRFAEDFLEKWCLSQLEGKNPQRSFVTID